MQRSSNTTTQAYMLLGQRRIVLSVLLGAAAGVQPSPLAWQRRDVISRPSGPPVDPLREPPDGASCLARTGPARRGRTSCPHTPLPDARLVARRAPRSPLLDVHLAAAISALRDLALALALLSWYGRTSNAASCRELPLLHGDISLMVQAFAANGLDVKDLAMLYGAHTLGKAHCPSYAARSSGGNTAAVWLAPAMNDGLEAEIRRPRSHLWRPSPPEPYSQTASPRLPPSPAHARRDLRSRELHQATPPNCLCSSAGNQPVAQVGY